jgi:hypothetical protein
MQGDSTDPITIHLANWSKYVRIVLRNEANQEKLRHVAYKWGQGSVDKTGINLLTKNC